MPLHILPAITDLSLDTTTVINAKRSTISITYRQKPKPKDRCGDGRRTPVPHSLLEQEAAQLPRAAE